MLARRWCSGSVDRVELALWSLNVCRHFESVTKERRKNLDGEEIFITLRKFILYARCKVFTIVV